MIDKKLETIELTPEENRMYVFLEQRCAEIQTRIIRPYFWHRSHAHELYTKRSEKKARGLYRGYILHLFVLGLLVRINKGLYYLKPATIVVKSIKSEQRGSQGHTKPFTVKQVGLLPARVRLDYIFSEVEQHVQVAVQATARAQELLVVARKVKDEL